MNKSPTPSVPASHSDQLLTETSASALQEQQQLPPGLTRAAWPLCEATRPRPSSPAGWARKPGSLDAESCCGWDLGAFNLKMVHILSALQKNSRTSWPGLNLEYLGTWRMEWITSKTKLPGQTDTRLKETAGFHGDKKTESSQSEDPRQSVLHRAAAGEVLGEKTTTQRC